HLGRPLLGQRVNDLLSVIAALGDEAGDGVALTASGTAGLIGLHAAALEPRITSLDLFSMTTSWSDVARSRVTRDQLASVVPGALAFYDAPDLAALVAPRPMRILGMADPAGWPVSQERIEATYTTAKEAYARNAGSQLAFTAGPVRPTRRPVVRTLD